MLETVTEPDLDSDAQPVTETVSLVELEAINVVLGLTEMDDS